MTVGALDFNALTVPVWPKGLGSPAVWLSGGRIASCLTQFGSLSEINYYGAQPIDRGSFFKVGTHSPYERLFCPYVVVEGKAWQLELHATRLYPGGYESRLLLAEVGIEIAHSLVLHNDALLYSIQVLRNDAGRTIRLRLSLHDHLAQAMPQRTWGKWRAEFGAQVLCITDPEGRIGAYYPDLAQTGRPSRPEKAQGLVTTWLGVVGSTTIQNQTFFSGRRHFETRDIRTDTAVIGVLFGHAEADFRERVAMLMREGAALSARRVAQWKGRLGAAPAVWLNRPAVESFFRHAGLINRSLTLEDFPGALRASAGHYWVWGWDTLVYGESELVSGDEAFVHDALALYRRTAHPELGIGHKFSERMEVLASQAGAAQALYINLLYQYVVYMGEDANWRECYPFARTIFQRTLRQPWCENLCTGSALWPDHPRFAGHANLEGEVSDQDISIFNNGIFYQAARALEFLAGLEGDNVTAQQARRAWQAQEKAFRRYFWNEERHYWIDSLETGSLQPRPSHPAHAILWINSFAKDLVAGREPACAEFLARHHACAGGIRPYPVWDPAFNGDGNQMAQWYPTGSDIYFLKMQATAGNQEWLVKWLDWVNEFWSAHTVPEGLTLEAENDGPHRPDCPGGKQAFVVKPWHMAIISVMAGLEIDAGGITMAPGLDEAVRLERLPWRGRQLAISTQGKGKFIRQLQINEKPVEGSYKIPMDLDKELEQSIMVVRTTEAPSRPTLLSADGLEVSELKSTSASLRFHLRGVIATRLRLWLPDAGAQVSWSGVAQSVELAEIPGVATLMLTPAGDRLEGDLVIG